MMKKKTISKVFAFLSVCLVLFMVFAVSVGAEQVGQSPYQLTDDLSQYFGTNYDGSLSIDNIYTFCIDIGAVAQSVYTYRVDDMYTNFLPFTAELENDGDIITVEVECFTWSYPNTVISIFINDEEVVSLTGQEVVDYGSTTDEEFLLIPFNSWDGLAIIDVPWQTPKPPYQIFNNLQLSNTKTYYAGYNVGFNTGHEQGYNEGYLQGQQDSSELGESGAQLITAVVEAPVNVFTKMLDFNILGVNVLGIVVALLSFALVIAILKKVI